MKSLIFLALFALGSEKHTAFPAVKRFGKIVLERTIFQYLSKAEKAAQLINIINGFLGWNSDHYKGYTFEYHKSHDLLLVRNSRSCWLVHGNKNLESRFDSKDTKEALEHEIYAQIQSHTGETKESLMDIRSDYHDIRALAECFRHSVYELTYTPSS